MAEGKGEKTALVVGDWAVDEHWVTRPYRTTMSSRIGREQYKVVHSPTGTATALAGAGRTAAALAAARPSGRNLVASMHARAGSALQVVGLGRCHPEDAELLCSMIDTQSYASESAYKLARGATNRSRTGPAARFLNLYSCAPWSSARDVEPTPERDPRATTRLVRVYEERPDSPSELLDRIDWDVEPARVPGTRRRSASIRAWVGRELRTMHVDRVDIVIVKDLGKGVVDRELVTALARLSALKEATWFVSTKHWRPKWFSVLPWPRVRTLVIPEIAARAAVQGHVEGLRRWTLPTGEPTYAAIRILTQTLPGLYSRKRAPWGSRVGGCSIVVMPENAPVLAFDSVAPDLAWRLDSPASPPKCEEERPPVLPLASVFLGAHVALETQHPSLGTLDAETRIARMARALQFTSTWQADEAGRINLPSKWDGREPALNVRCSLLPALEHIRRVDIAQERKAWHRALVTGDGIINRRRVASPRVVAPWRAMTDLDGYVCIDEKRRQAMGRLVDAVDEFVHRPNRSVSVLLRAPPGVGKSFLVDRLVRQFHLKLRKFDVTELRSPETVVDWFHEIVTTQLTLENGETLLVFVDEINAEVRGDNLYAAFLQPLDSSTYVHAARRFHIKPCIWVFAGTQVSPEKAKHRLRRRTHAGTPDELLRARKKSDFESRVTHCVDFEPIDPGRQADLEAVYVAVSELARRHRGIDSVSLNALSVFARMGREGSDNRAIRKAAEGVLPGAASRLTVDMLKRGGISPELDSVVLSRGFKGLTDEAAGKAEFLTIERRPGVLEEV